MSTAGRTQMTFLGHATFRLASPEGRQVIVDPWTHRNPLCPPELRDVGPLDLALVTHGHPDHLGDLYPPFVRNIALRSSRSPSSGIGCGATGCTGCRR
jgi:phosphoribosyl 1,2-cyclic phosphodiesterase